MLNIAKGVELYNDYDFFAAHDYFEDLWTDAGPKEKKFLQALVQLSVAGFHSISGNYRGAFSQYTKARKKFLFYNSPYEKIDVLSLIEQIDIVLSELNDYFSKKNLKIDLKKLPSLIYLG